MSNGPVARPAQRSWIIEIPGRPPTVNSLQRGYVISVAGSHKQAREASQKVAQIRRDATILTRAARVPVLGLGRFFYYARYEKKRGREPDWGAFASAFKAALDGVVDAGVLPDDSRKFIPDAPTELPISYGGSPALVVLIEDAAGDHTQTLESR